MNVKIILAIATAIFVIIFAVQNAVEVDLRFIAWEFSGSLSLFLILSIIFGIIIGSLFTISLRKKVKDEPTRVNDSTLKK